MLKKILFFVIFSTISLLAQTWVQQSTPGYTYFETKYGRWISRNDTIWYPGAGYSSGGQNGYIAYINWHTLLPVKKSAPFRGGYSVTNMTGTYDPDSTDVWYFTTSYYGSTAFERANVNVGTKVSLTPLYSSTVGFQVWTVGHKILGINNSTRLISTYNPSTDTWTSTGNTLPQYMYMWFVYGNYNYAIGSQTTAFYFAYDIQASDSTNQAHLYRIDSTGAYTDLGAIGTKVNRCPQINVFISPVSGDTSLIFNMWGDAYNSTWGTFAYNLNTSTFYYYGHPTGMNAYDDPSHVRVGGVAGNDEMGIIYAQYGSGTSGTDSTTCVWAFTPADSIWRKLPFIKNGTYYYGADHLWFRNDTLLALASAQDSYVGSVFMIPNSTTSAIKDSVPASLIVTNPVVNPSNPRFIQDDSVMVTYDCNYPLDSVALYIEYGNGYNFVKYLTDTTYCSLDTISVGELTARLKLVSYPYSLESYSDEFTILGNKALAIDSAIFIAKSPPTILDSLYLTITYRGLDSLMCLIGNDSLNPNILLGTIVLDHSTFDTTITIKYPLNYALSKPYVKVAEFRDTTIYGLSVINYYQTVGLVYNMQFCLEWVMYETGARWIVDPGCGWTSVGRTNGQSVIYVDNDSLKAAYATESVGSGPLTYPLDYQNGFEDTVTANGRRYYLGEHDEIIMEDLVNNVEYTVTDSLPISSYYGLAVMEGKLVVVYTDSRYSLGGFNVPDAHLYSILSYPADSTAALSDTQALRSPSDGSGEEPADETIILKSYRGIFRGIYPKAKK
jgi:hypothetical protein